MIVFVRPARDEAALEALHFSLSALERWRDVRWRWGDVTQRPSLGLAITEGRCAWGALSLTREAVYATLGQEVSAAERLASRVADQALLSEALFELLEPHLDELLAEGIELSPLTLEGEPVWKLSVKAERKQP